MSQPRAHRAKRDAGKATPAGLLNCYRNISSMADVEGRALCPGSIPGIPNTLPEVDLAQSITADGRLKRNV
uniref:Uncharacterized protein n=1 Tax=Siphoviridae sp. ctmIh35 TaxID=2827932 RepID=A0A8S5T906_9CAUD|nr:MAG TPA: hypothetical protein [Siphoviridae sp. ctmIh35]DAR11970.1 MAG TPA: hypothetical protein [Bacteriophage sp.]